MDQGLHRPVLRLLWHVTPLHSPSRSTHGAVAYHRAFGDQILEATTLDVLGGNLPHTLNAIAGFLLIATLPRGSDSVKIATDGTRDLHYTGTSRLWIVGYTVWNWTLVCLNYPEYAGHHVAVLAVTLAIGLFDPRRWLQARTFILAAALIVLASFAPLLLPRIDTTTWNNAELYSLAAGIAFAVAIGCAVWLHTPANAPVVA